LAIIFIKTFGELMCNEESYLKEGSCFSRSKLYNIEPIGLNTAYTESLTSYITRISKAHSVYVGTLIKLELAPILDKYYILNSSFNGGNSFYSYTHILNGNGKNADDFANALSEMVCRKDILFTTMLSYRNVIPYQGLSKNTASWCPFCLEEWRIANKPIYMPLAWTLKVSNICNIHNTRLVSRCPICNSKIPFLHRKICNGYCPRCRAWLGRGYDQNVSQLIKTDDWEKWVNCNIGELISMAPVISILPSREILEENLKHIINTSNNITRLSKLTEIPKSTVWYWANGKTIPRLDKCYCSAIDKIDVLSRW